MGKTKGILICVCSKATEVYCGNCIKRKHLKPDVKMNHPSWKRNVDDIIKKQCELTREVIE